MIELKENVAVASKVTGSRPIMTIKETARECSSESCVAVSNDCGEA